MTAHGFSNPSVIVQEGGAREIFGVVLAAACDAAAVNCSAVQSPKCYAPLNAGSWRKGITAWS